MRSWSRLTTSSMATSFFKYGAVAEAYPSKVDALDSLQRRLNAYQDTGNAVEAQQAYLDALGYNPDTDKVETEGDGITDFWKSNTAKLTRGKKPAPKPEPQAPRKPHGKAWAAPLRAWRRCQICS